MSNKDSSAPPPESGRRPYVAEGDAVSVNRGGARIIIDGEVGDFAIVQAVGGGARIEVHGPVGECVILRVIGGGAEIRCHSTVHPTAQLIAEGGGAKVWIAKSLAAL